ncbi:hypothetical protein GGS23DRAFT_558719 [Durotheca rogersii]|uniref:uncharacterized protein n=1 Tax=Durotheca rogersii TaxID=419775 RepID=UPI0022207222|nr:uncharacterized protein GGS23DRAFT_558719 [Durotheca rogersii]KAI5865322.1 hypothetical protein GGS23DRAFT_558719 [Durotheca rogersii]
MRVSIAAALTFAIGALAAPQQFGGPIGTTGGITPGGPSSRAGSISPHGAFVPAEFPEAPGDVTVGQAGDTCGSELDLSCCDKVDQSGDAINAASGLLAGLLGGALEGGELGLFDGCSKLNVAALIGLTDLLDNQCKQTPACCQHSGMDQGQGLVNVGLPCVALGGIL